MKQIPCIFCGKLNREVVIEENGFLGVKCESCSLIYISPRPDDEEVTHLYSDTHAVLYADAQFQFDKFNRMEASRTLAKIRQFKLGGQLLELGPGGGGFLAEAGKCGYQPHGIELNPIEARWIREKLRLPCESAALSAASFEGKQFDVIYHRDVLSHLPHPIESFKEMHRALKIDGLLIFETGNIADVNRKYLKYFSQFSYPDHLFFFGEASINTLLAKTGFKLLRIDREPILLQLILQKALWKLKDALKDENAKVDMGSKQALAPGRPSALSPRRRLRNYYRYVRYYFVRCGRFLPKKGRPMKLLVFAQNGGNK